MYESFVNLKSKYESKEIPNLLHLIKFYIFFLVGSVVASTLWNGVWWLPSLLLDLYVAASIGAGGVQALNIAISLTLFYILYKVGNLINNFMAKRKKRPDGVPLLSQQLSQHYDSINVNA
jgi:hypothetical protein